MKITKRKTHWTLSLTDDEAKLLRHLVGCGTSPLAKKQCRHRDIQDDTFAYELEMVLQEAQVPV
jgi:hypothetical protein